MDSKKGRKIGMYVLYGAITVFMLAFILSLGDVDEILSTVGSADYRYVLAAAGALIIYLALYPISLCILTRANGHKISHRKTYCIAMTEHFFNGITPFATGGQPFQAYAFKRAGISIAGSTSLLLMNFFVFMLVTNGFATCALVYFKRFVSDGAMTAIAIIGFTMNFIVLAITLGIATSKTARSFFTWIIDTLAKWRLTKRLVASKKENLNEYFLNVQAAFRSLIKKKLAFLFALLSKIASMCAYYATTFFILRALEVNVPVNELFFIISGTSFAITMVVFLPTPGSSGGIEFAFKSVFASIVTLYAPTLAIDTVATGGMLMWRVLTYYLVMLISLAFYIGLEAAFQKQPEEKLQENPLKKENEND